MMRNGYAGGIVWYAPYYRSPETRLLDRWNAGLATGAGIVGAVVLGLVLIATLGALP